jgi:putative peptidoglycan lipid II flippase
VRAALSMSNAPLTEALSDPPRPRTRARSGALAVAAGILASRLVGFVRERALSHYLGNSAASGAFRAALRIPNLLQNLLGEGVLSASFIPVYARLLAERRTAEASRLARVIASLLALCASTVAALGITFAPQLIAVLAPGFDGEVRALTVQLVRVLFPGTALLVLSAWCLGVQNGHRKFFLSYVSPVVWNGALIACALWFGAETASGRTGEFAFAERLAWAAVVGSALQLLVQLPLVWTLLKSLTPALDLTAPGVRQTLGAFGPVLLGRGSVQISAYLDQVLSSFLGPSLVSALAYAQTIYLLPVALFGMSISAAELPEMSSALGSESEIAAQLRQRLATGLRQILFLVVPSALAFVSIGGVLVAALYQSGHFGARDTRIVWLVLSGSAIGLSAGTQARLLASAFYELGDTKTPLRWALIRVACSFVGGYLVVLPLRAHFGYAALWSAFGLSANAGFAAWIEFSGLRASLARRLGGMPKLRGFVFEVYALALISGAAGFGMAELTRGLGPWLRVMLVAPVFGAVYLAAAKARKLPEVDRLLARIRRR